MQKHGEKREGAGRPSLGITKKVSITLSEEDWKRIEGTVLLQSFLNEIKKVRNQFLLYTSKREATL